jgi:hypothetical protein
MESGEATGGRSRGGTTGSHGPGTHEAEPERSIRILSSRGPAPRPVPDRSPPAGKRRRRPTRASGSSADSAAPGLRGPGGQ